MNIVGRRNWYFGLSLFIILPGIVSMAVLGFRLGIDFQGGSQLNLVFVNPVQASAVQREVDTFSVDGTVQQTTAKGVQKPLFLSRRISFCVQPSLLAANLLDYQNEHNCSSI